MSGPGSALRIPWLSVEKRWRDEVLSGILPVETAIDVPPDTLEHASFWRHFEAEAPVTLYWGVRLSVWFVVLASLLLAPSHKTFGRLPRIEQDQLLQRLESSPVYLNRQVIVTLKIVACWAMFRDERVRGHFSFTTP